MKKMKKVLAMLLSFIMMMSMAMTTFAAPGTKADATLTVLQSRNNSGRHVVSYKLFKLDNVDNTSATDAGKLRNEYDLQELNWMTQQLTKLQQFKMVMLLRKRIFLKRY